MIHPVKLDPATHIYTIPGPIVVPGYSEICAAMGVTRPNKFYTEEGRVEGQALHKWLRFLVTVRTPSSPPDPRIAGRVAGIRKFIKESGIRFVGGESPRYDPRTRVACTKDLWGYIGPWAWVIDAKRGSKLASHRLQTACQKIVLTANDFRPQKRAALYLKDGDYRLDEHTEPIDEKNWRAIASGYHAMTSSQRLIFSAEGFYPARPDVLDMKPGAAWAEVVSAWNAKKIYY
jgi:hypothetical protein